MRDELYINGVKADLLENHINLNYSSNLLTDVGKIVSNNSYTIKLPKTSGNLFFVECAHIPSSESKFPYLKHAARLVRDGVEMISDANVVLLAVNEYIEIALSWGNVNNLAPISSDSLRDLNYRDEDFVIWSKGENSRTFPLIDYGFRETEQTVWYHPAVSVKWVIDKIAESAGVTFDLPSDRLNELNEMFLPLMERNDSERQSGLNAYNLYAFDFSQLAFFRMLRFNENHLGEQYFIMKDANTIKAKNHKCKIDVSGYVTFEVDVNGENGNPNSKAEQIRMQIRRMKGTEIEDLKFSVLGDIEHISGSRYRYTFNFIDCSFDLEPNEEVVFNIVDIYTIGTDCYHVSIVVGESGSLYVKGEYPEINVGDKYYFVPNLPDIKQIDFVKAIANMLGLFAIPTDNDTIKLISFDELNHNKSKSPDWTKLIMHHTNDSLPNNMEFALNDMAHINWFKYKKEKDKLNDESTIIVDNLTLEYERTAVELPFACTEMRKGIAYIPLYEYKDDKPESKSLTPRILRYQDNTGVFTGLSWNTLLNKYYDSYKELVTKAKVITEYVHLNSVQLKHVDLTVPVYLAQYGSYFAIINIKTKDDNVCEVKLLKM